MGRVVWIEFKRPRKEPTDLQHIEITAMRSHGLIVYWLDDLQDFKAILAAHEGAA